MMHWQTPSTANTFPAIQTPQGRLLTFGALWRRRDYGRTGSRSKGADFVVFIPARSLRRSTSYCDDATFAIRDERDEEVEPSAPFPFAFLFAFSVPR
jgi:hypothetical protein